MEVLVRGGGRWSRAIVATLLQICDDADHVTWVAGRALEAARSFAARLSENEGPACGRRPAIVRDIENGPITFDAIVLATATASRAGDLDDLLDRFSPRCILVEKPFAAHVDDARKVLKRAVPGALDFLVDLEFRLASYVEDARSAVRSWEIESIVVDWSDPPVEHRLGERKTPDWHTHIARDQGSHVWSLIDRIVPDVLWNVTGAAVSDDASGIALTIEGRPSLECLEQISAVAHLSRRASRRRRVLVIRARDGREMSLDFSIEPGELIVDGKIIDVATAWNREARPLRRALQSLLDVARGSPSSDAAVISATACLPAVAFVDEAEAACRMEARRLMAAGGALTHAAAAALVDCVVPDLADSGLFIDTDRRESLEELAQLLWSMRR